MYRMEDAGNYTTDNDTTQKLIVRDNNTGEIVATVLDVYIGTGASETHITSTEGYGIYSGPFIFHTDCYKKIEEFYKQK